MASGTAFVFISQMKYMSSDAGVRLKQTKPRGSRNDPPMDFYSRSIGCSHRPVLEPGSLRAAKARYLATV